MKQIYGFPSVVQVERIANKVIVVDIIAPSL